MILNLNKSQYLKGNSIEGARLPNTNLLPLGVGATGTVFRLHFLGSVEVDEEGGRKRRKRLKKNMVELAVTKIKVCVIDNKILHTRFQFNIITLITILSPPIQIKH